MPCYVIQFQGALFQQRPTKTVLKYVIGSRGMGVMGQEALRPHDVNERRDLVLS